MAENNYLIEWKDQFSLPNYLTGNSFLSPDGSSVSGNETSLNLAQNILLNGSAVGTHDKHFLNPTPLFNKLGEIYTTIVNSAFTSARTDAIKMNRYNMDYTNGESTLKAENLPIHEFFRFFEDTNDFEINTQANAQRLAGMLATLEGKGTPEANSENIKFSITNLNDYYYNIIQYWGNTWFNHYPEIEQFLIDTGLTGGGYITYIIEFGDGLEPEEYYVPSVRMSSLLAQYLAQYGTGAAGLQLLMPQYKRRVEVEDLNENFWVISQILDAVVNALWGPYGLIDVLRQLIFKITQIEEYLGLDQVEDIDIMMAGDDDMYFDMYSRFELSSLQLKLKTPTGERVLKDIFKNHNERSDRNNTTDYGQDLETFYKQVQQEIMPSTGDDNKSSTGLYDSDIIRSLKPTQIRKGAPEQFVSLSAVIDALNDRVVEGDIDYYYYTYQGDSSAIGQILKVLDPTKDGIMSAVDVETRKKDIITNGTLLSKDEIEKLKLSDYEEIKNIILGNNSLTTEITNYYKQVHGSTTKTAEELCFRNINIKTSDKADDDNTMISNKYFNNFLSEYENITNNFENSDITISEEVKNNLTSINVNEALREDYKRLLLLNEFIDKNKEDKNWHTMKINFKNDDTIFVEQTIEYYSFTDEDRKRLDKVIKTQASIYKLTVRSAALVARILSLSPDPELLESNFREVYGNNYLYTCLSSVMNDGTLNVRDAAAIASQVAGGKEPSIDNYYNIKKAGEYYWNSAKQEELIAKEIKINAKGTDEDGNEIEVEKTVSAPGIKTLIKREVLNLSDALETYEKSVQVPTEFFFEFLISHFKTEDNGKNLTAKKEDIPKLINSINSTEYGLWDNILIFLYDANYYDYKNSGEGKRGLYVKNKDDFYNTTNPLISSTPKGKEDRTHILFVPRKDLYQGEVIQLRMTPKNMTKQYLDFTNLNTSTEEGQEAFTLAESNSKLFLSLHNCFSVNPTYNNTRTTLFFKDTTPELEPVINKETFNIKSVSDWFCNGIGCYYFKPVIQIEKGKKIFVPKSKSFNLKIYASMIAKRDNYTDNSFIVENVTTAPTEPQDMSLNDYESDFRQIKKFERKQQYCAAMRHNLIFYSTPGLNENNQYIHSPLQLLMSARNRGDSDSIQTTRTFGTALSNGRQPTAGIDTFTKVEYPAGKGTGDLTLDEIKTMLYSNAYSESVPLTIQAFFGTRKVDEYIKWKQMKYVVFEKESGNRNDIFGPTYATITAYDGYMHWDKNLSVSKNNNTKYLKTYHCPIFWVYTEKIKDNGVTKEIYKVASSDQNNGYPPKNVKYGYIKLPAEFTSATYSSAFSIQIFSCGKNGEDMKKKENHQLKEEIENQDRDFHRRPIFKTAYFFGINEDGMGNAKHAPYRE